MRLLVECFSRNSYHSLNVSSEEVMILTSFLRSAIPLTEPPSLSGLILWKRLTMSVLIVCKHRLI
jgi:hypothetical protein